MKDTGGGTCLLMVKMKTVFCKLLQRNRKEITKKLYHSIIHDVLKYCIKYVLKNCLKKTPSPKTKKRWKKLQRQMIKDVK